MLTTGIKRRTWLALLALAPPLAVAVATSGAAADAVTPLDPAQLTPWTRTIAFPPVIDGSAGGTVRLDEVAGSHVFGSTIAGPLPGTASFGFQLHGTTAPWRRAEGDVYLGPIIEAKRGVPLKVSITNQLAVKGADASAPAVCQSRGLVTIHPLAAYFDTTLEGNVPLDACAPRTATHLHGGHTPTRADGGPLDTYRAAGIDMVDYAAGSGAYTSGYPNDQEAAGLWYHDHALGITRLNPLAGLAGLDYIRDKWDNGGPNTPLGLPANRYSVSPVKGMTILTPTTVGEIPLVLQDKNLNTDGSYNYDVQSTAFHPTWSPESFGDIPVVNGVAFANVPVNRGLFRFRVYNASQSRIYQLHLESVGGGADLPPVYEIGAEGGLFNAVVRLDTVTVAPGERADLLIDFRRAAGAYRWVNTANVPFPDGDETVLTQTLQFTVAPTVGYSPAAGTPLADLADGTVLRQVTGGGSGAQPAAVDVAALSARSTATRTMFLNEALDPDDDPVAVLLNNLPFLVNGTFRTVGIARPRVNTVETWQIVNTTGDTHPIHLHATQFAVVARQGIDGEAYLHAVNPGLPLATSDGTPRGDWYAGTGVASSNGIVAPPDPVRYLLAGTRAGPYPEETGWKDTVRVNPNEMVTIVVPFGGTAAGIPSAFRGDAATASQRFTGTYVWHCHILEHEENDMMQPYTITP